MTVSKELQLEPCPCYDCSTIEGESELSRNGSIGSLGINQHLYQHIYLLPLHTGAMTRDLAVEQYPTQKDPCTHPTTLRTPQVTNLEHNQDATSDLSHHCTVSDCSLITKC